MAILQSALKEKLSQQLAFIYQEIKLNQPLSSIVNELLEIMEIDEEHPLPIPHLNHWSEKDVCLITYGDSIVRKGESPLQTLKSFLDSHISEQISNVHILPFFPFSSDDGFAVIDYMSVNKNLGNWEDIFALSKSYKVMADIVINHCSSQHKWFQNFVDGNGEGEDYFFTTLPEHNLSQVIRPRTSPLLRETKASKEVKFVWCTFSHDQVDLDFRNPKVLIAFVKIIKHYLENGITIFRFDAIAFLWKKIGTKCINLPQTHEVVRLLRTLIETKCPEAVIITETNIPNTQNLTYFGNANEAHGIYNFSLPPLLINTLLTGSCLYLKRWLMSMPPAQNGTMYFNFIASHDGIGLRPAEGLLNEQELTDLVNTIESFGGKVSWRTTESGQQKAYELNISLYDAMQGTVKGKDKWNLERFICAHAIMFALEGIPGIYIHSLLGTQNDYDKIAQTHQNRSINRHSWQEPLLREALNDEKRHHKKVLNKLTNLIDIRIKQAAFHPNATQFTLHLGMQLFGFWRQSQDRQQSIFCVSNITDKPVRLPLSELNLIITETWTELISDSKITAITQELELSPYQTVWISNK